MRVDPLLDHYPVRIREVTFGVILSIAILFYLLPRFLGEAKKFANNIQEEIETFDVLEINTISAGLIEKVRNTKTPHCLIINTYRFASHSKSDDGRDQNEVEKWKTNDPLIIAENELDPKVVNDIK